VCLVKVAVLIYRANIMIIIVLYVNNIFNMKLILKEFVYVFFNELFLLTVEQV